jgi:hypothetical protein
MPTLSLDDDHHDYPGKEAPARARRTLEGAVPVVMGTSASDRRH